MAPGPLDTEIENFIATCINSVEQFEILLLLKQHGELEAETINRELRTSVTSVVKRLDDLARKNLISPREDKETNRIYYKYDPSPKYGDVIDRLAAIYPTHRVAIINLIFSKPQDILKDFSEAFRLREKDK